MLDDADVRVERGYGAAALAVLARADARGHVGDLALQVGQRDDVVVDHADGADAGGREIQR